MNGDKKVIDTLNKVLKKEVTAIKIGRAALRERG